MGGKSVYIRQTALIALMAQMGSFVPAASAKLGLVDRIFTRSGSADELTRGASTFMVEMTETANILRHATNRSLIVLDEIGRGTSTYDGLALAWAVVEHIHNATGARTLFATHYHELTDLARTLPMVRNHHVTVREWKGDVVFLHRIEPGPTDRSYGIHVARLAGIPRDVIERARRILRTLEKPRGVDPTQPTLFDEPAPPPDPARDLVDEIASIDANALTPLEALQRLADLVKKVRAK